MKKRDYDKKKLEKSMLAVDMLTLSHDGKEDTAEYNRIRNKVVKLREELAAANINKQEEQLYDGIY